MTTAFVTPADLVADLDAQVDVARTVALALVRERGSMPLRDVIGAVLSSAEVRADSTSVGRQVVSKALLNLLDAGELTLDDERVLTASERVGQ